MLLSFISRFAGVLLQSTLLRLDCRIFLDGKLQFWITFVWKVSGKLEPKHRFKDLKLQRNLINSHLIKALFLPDQNLLYFLHEQTERDTRYTLMHASSLSSYQLSSSKYRLASLCVRICLLCVSLYCMYVY